MKKAKKIVKVIVIVLLVLVILGVTGGSYVVGKMVRDGVMNQNEGNDTKGNSIKQLEKWGYDTQAFLDTYEHKDFSVEAEDGVVVPGTIFQAAEESDAYVIIAHGAGGDRNCVLPVAEVFLKNGYHVIAYDQRGSGDSGSSYVTFGIWEKRDVKRLVDYARQDLQAEKVIVLGQSMGGMTVALYAATEHAEKNVDAVILDSPVPGMELMLRHMFTEDGTSVDTANYIIGCGDVYCRLFEHFSFEEGDTIAQMVHNNCKTLVILSEKDEICLPEEEEQLFANIASTDKELVRIDAAHIEGVIDHPEEYEKAIIDFLAE